MCQLFESIKVEGRKLCNIGAHNERFNRSRKDLFGLSSYLDLGEIIQIPESLGNGIYKCKVIYSKTIQEVEFQVYTKRNIQTLQPGPNP